MKPEAQTPYESLPTSSGNLFEFVFSNPFHRSSPYTKSTPAVRQGHCMREKIPLDKPAFVDGVSKTSISWERLRVDSLRVASSLVGDQPGLGLHPTSLSSSNPSVNRGAVVSPVVLLLLPNCIPFCVLAYGVLASGLTLSGLNPAATAVELLHVLKTSLPSAVVVTGSGLGVLQEVYKQLSTEEKKTLAYPSEGNIFVVDVADETYLTGISEGPYAQASQSANGWKVQNWKALLQSSNTDFQPPEYSGNEDVLRTAVVFWSSGTSGKSKGVLQSHRALGSGLISLWHGGDIRAGERMIGLPPLYHIFGWSSVFTVAPVLGSTTYLLQKFDPQGYLKLVQDVKATHLHIAPPLAVLFAKSPLVDGFDLSSIHNCTSGGAPLAISIVKAVRARLGFTIKAAYGLSETGGVSFQTGKNWEEDLKLLGSVGKVVPGTEIKIVSTDDERRLLREDEQGEILIKSPSLVTAYYNNPQATEESLDSEGWLRTGDVGRMVAGQIYIEERLKELIKVKGFQVAPAELEDGLCSSPLVQDAGVTSIYNEDDATEYPIAYIVPFNKRFLSPGPDTETFAHELRKVIEEKFTRYKWIKGGFVMVDEIPKSPAGKILRRLLKDKKGLHVKVYGVKIQAKL